MSTEELVNNFICVSQSSENQARFYLQASNWDLERALINYYESNNEDLLNAIPESRETPEMTDFPEFPENPSHFSINQPKKKPTTRKIGLATLSDLNDEEALNFPQNPLIGSRTNNSLNRQEESYNNRKKGFVTLSDYKKESDQETSQQNFFAGGGENSGQLITGPPRSSDHVAVIIEKARRQGTKIFEDSEDQYTKSKKLKNFKGTGYVLGSDEKDSELAVGDSEDDSAESQFITITFWQSGFQIDNGKFRSNADPQNAAFLEDVKSGVAPRELQERLIGRKGGTVNLKIVDRRHEDFKPNKLAPKPFAGRGHMLGSPAPALVTEATADSLKLQEHVPKVDTNKETTFIQVRLADGTRVEVEMNYDHTVGQLRDFVRATSNVTGPFKLMTSFPLKELSDDSQTISEAGLLKAVVIQKL